MNNNNPIQSSPPAPFPFMLLVATIGLYLYIDKYMQEMRETATRHHDSNMVSSIMEDVIPILLQNKPPIMFQIHDVNRFH